jgi:16S rRNA processing protein RimM
LASEPIHKYDQDNWRGAAGSSAEPRFLLIGEVSKPHGVRGEVRVRPHTELPERFTWLEFVYLGQANPRRVGVESARIAGSSILLKLSGYDDRNAAETLRGEWLQVPEEEGIGLAEGEYYLYQLEGVNVVTEDGQPLGRIVSIIETGANNVFVVAGPRGEILLPDTTEVVRELDLDQGLMTVRLIPGLLPE